jgi:hypothetical protein
LKSVILVRVGMSEIVETLRSLPDGDADTE